MSNNTTRPSQDPSLPTGARLGSLRSQNGIGTTLRILFVCTGNTCRSPMAEGLCRALAKKVGALEVHAASAGVDGSVELLAQVSRAGGLAELLVTEDEVADALLRIVMRRPQLLA